MTTTKPPTTTPRLSWPPIIARAAEIVNSYDDTQVTLRQLFYRLVAEQTLPNTKNVYKRLSELTAQARRTGTFPDLADRGRAIHRAMSFRDPDDALDWLVEHLYRRDRTAGQDVSLYLAVEKAGLIAQLETWFGERGVPILAVGGFSSQSYVTEVLRDIPDHRPAVLIYAGDFDPSGEDIDRDFVARSNGRWDKVIRVALTEDLIRDLALPFNFIDSLSKEDKGNDSRALKFVERHRDFITEELGRAVPADLTALTPDELREFVVQVEVDALPPETLRQLFLDAIEPFWDPAAYQATLALERADRETLRNLRR